MTSAPLTKIRKARLVGKFPRNRSQNWVMVGQDGGQSVRCGGTTVFFFSDTLLVTSETCSRTGQIEFAPTLPQGMQTVFLANCAAVSQETGMEKALSTLEYYSDDAGFPREILPADERDRFRRLRFWPEHGLYLNGRLYFFYLGIQTTDPSTVWGFRVVGTGLATLDPGTGICSRLQHRNSWIFWRNDAEDTHFGAQVLLWEGFVYVFGSSRDNVRNSVLLARVRAESIEDHRAYEYLSSAQPRWSTNLADAMTLGPASSEYSVCWNAHLGKFVMFYLDSYQKRLVIRTAEFVWGPFSEPRELFRVPCRQTSELAYLGFEHSAFQQDSGRSVFVSYCEPHFSLPSLVTISFDQLRSSG
jgi:hypothetical protein